MIFFTIFAGLLILVYVYIGRRIISPFEITRSVRITAWLTLLTSPFLLPLSYYLRIKNVSSTLGDTIAWLGYVILGFLSLILILLLIRDVLLLLVKILKKPVRAIGKIYTSSELFKPNLPDLNRRRFVFHSMNLGILGASGLMTIAGFYEARRSPEITRVDVPIDGLPRELNGFRIAQISDIHVGPTIKRDWVASIVEQVNALEADLVVLTGDLVDGPVPWLADDVAPLADIESRHGAFFVTGNHEYYSGVEEWIREVRKLGFTVLVNEHTLIETKGGSIALAGVPDHRAGGFVESHRPDPSGALDGAPPEALRILLAHQPQTIYQAAEAGFHLQLSGHTHGGQNILWRPVVALTQPFISGLNRYENTWVYVNSGTGYWGPPTRFGVPSEITLLRLIS